MLAVVDGPEAPLVCAGHSPFVALLNPDGNALPAGDL